VARIALGFAMEEVVATLFLRGEARSGTVSKIGSNFEVNGLTLVEPS
jgi:hypothetical protein